MVANCLSTETKVHTPHAANLNFKKHHKNSKKYNSYKGGERRHLPAILQPGLLAGWQQAFQSCVLSQGLILVSDKGSPGRAPGRCHATPSSLASLPGANSLLLSRLAVRQMCEPLLGCAAGRWCEWHRSFLQLGRENSLLLHTSHHHDDNHLLDHGQMLSWTHPLWGADLLNSPQPQILMPLGSCCLQQMLPLHGDCSPPHSTSRHLSHCCRTRARTKTSGCFLKGSSAGSGWGHRQSKCRGQHFSLRLAEKFHRLGDTTWGKNPLSVPGKHTV